MLTFVLLPINFRSHFHSSLQFLIPLDICLGLALMSREVFYDSFVLLMVSLELVLTELFSDQC